MARLTSTGPTLQQVADAAGVSLATASRVLHGSGGRKVDPSLTSRVVDAATRLRYVAHALAQSLARSRSTIVGLLVHDIADPYFAAIAAGAMRVAREHDLMVLVANTFRDPELERDYLARLRAQRARAVLLAGSAFTGFSLMDELTAFAASGGRIAAIGGHNGQSDHPGSGRDQGDEQILKTVPSTSVARNGDGQDSSQDNEQGNGQHSRQGDEPRRGQGDGPGDEQRNGPGDGPSSGQSNGSGDEQRNGQSNGPGDGPSGAQSNGPGGGPSGAQGTGQRHGPGDGNSDGQGAGFDTVVLDNAGGARQAATHLAELGHREVGVVTGPSTLATVAARLAGFAAVLPPAAVIESDFTREGGRQSTLDLLRDHPRLTAVFAHNDLMAVGALAALRELGRTDVSVVGFDDLPVAVDVTPALTTVRLDLMAIGAAAMELVLGDQPPGRSIEIPATLVVRDSTTPASPTNGG